MAHLQFHVRESAHVFLSVHAGPFLLTLAGIAPHCDDSLMKQELPLGFSEAQDGEREGGEEKHREQTAEREEVRSAMFHC